MSKTLYPVQTEKPATYGELVVVAVVMILFFGVLLALLIGGFHCLESGYLFNGGI